MIATEHVIEITYLVATGLFVLSLKWLSSPATARRGVWSGEAGMLLAVGGTLLYQGIVSYRWIAIAAATSNIVGGFLITDRMLKMFKASGPRKP